jgi:hypothetical protein
MMMDKERKFIFLHIPRTGGTSIEEQFKHNECKKHWALSDWKKKLDPNIFDQCFKFTFVRNPWDFVISKYKCNWFTKHHAGGAIGEQAGKPLIYFLEHYKTPAHERGETFHDYFDPKQMDFIGRFENRENDLEYISKKIGISIDSKIHTRKVQVRDKNKKHYTEYYDDETREIIAEKYAKDIEYFGYKFGE